MTLALPIEIPKPARPADLTAALAALGIATTRIDHEPVFTVAESKELRGKIDGHHTKNLFLKDKKGRLFLVSAPESTKIDLKRLHERLGASGRLSFGSAELLFDKLGVAPGSVTAFAVINDREGAVTMVLDAKLMSGEPMNFHPLVNTATLGIARDDMLTFLRAAGHEPLIVDLPAPTEA